jgi:hypothetical protein
MAISLSAAAARHVTRYLAKLGSGVGVRMLYDFIHKNYC